MSGNQFIIAGPSVWRRESPAEIGERFLRTLDSLSSINRHFSSWGLVDLEGEPNETGFALGDVRPNFADIVERGVVKDDYGNPEPDSGYTVDAVNDYEDLRIDPFSVSLSVHAGGDGHWPRGADFETGSGQVPDPEIVAYPVFRSVLMTLVRDWEAKHSQAFSNELSREWDYPAFNFDLAWMTYLSAPLAAQIKPPAEVVVEKTPDGGLLLIAAKETFDTNNPKHMAAAYRIRDAMAPLNDLEEHERLKQEKAEHFRRFKASGFPGELSTGRRRPFP